MNRLALWNYLGVGTALMLTASPLYPEGTVTESLQAPFVAGGEITIQLSAGTHQITESPDNTIRIRLSVGQESADRQVKARTDVDGLKATIELDGPRNNFRTVIEVPSHSDLIVRLTAGELTVEKILGDKDIRLRAGDLSIDVGDAGEYRQIEGSVWAGDIDGGPLNLETGGLFRSIEWQGDGKYELRFHLYAGDVRLYEPQGEG